MAKRVVDEYEKVLAALRASPGCKRVVEVTNTTVTMLPKASAAAVKKILGK